MKPVLEGVSPQNDEFGVCLWLRSTNTPHFGTILVFVDGELPGKLTLIFYQSKCVDSTIEPDITYRVNRIYAILTECRQNFKQGIH
jgi:hypothetical protein